MLLEKGVPRGFFTEDEVEPALGRISTTTDLADFADRDFVTEAVFEDKDIKSDLLKRLVSILPGNCLIASNTSTIPISTLAAALPTERRGCFIGTHYFSPVSRMQLVEEGVAKPEDLDTACRLGLGHPIGPFALMAAVTSSLCVQAQEIMQDAYDERFRPPPLLNLRVQACYSGGKSRPGWYPAK